MITEYKIDELNRKISSCNNCNLWKNKNNYVIGNGSINSKIVFIGEAPGFNEDISGKPFVGKAGKILDELLLYIGLKRENVYITNILKCRPPNNRNPTTDEIKICTKYLDDELSIIKPYLIITLGNFSSKFIFNKYKLKFSKISDVHGKIFSLNLIDTNLYISPQYHPAFAVYNPNNIKIIKNDFKNIKNIIIKNYY